ncbi:MAG: hypothetical protein U9O85_11550 [Euryarchaeota archaeon]|nr:hypothetical protein [Euryarchaeota archaeon]
MNNKSKSLDNLSASRKLISDKKKDIQKWNEAIPTLNRAEEEIEWQIDGIFILPSEEIDNDITERTENQYDYWVDAIEAPAKLYPATTSGTAINTSGSSGIYNRLNEYSNKLPVNASIKLYPMFNRYEIIHESPNRKEELNQRFCSITQVPPSVNNKPKLNELFENAMTAIEHVKSKTATMSTAGSAMRNVLIELKGHLYYYSQSTSGSKENRWNNMAKTLAKTGESGPEYAALLKEYDIFQALHSDLSALTKDNRPFSTGDLNRLVTRFLSHLEVVLNSTDSAKLV